jgi:hypothetical protein
MIWALILNLAFAEYESCEIYEPKTNGLWLFYSENGTTVYDGSYMTGPPPDVNNTAMTKADF